MKADYSHNDGLPPLTPKGVHELSEAFEKWFTKHLLLEGSSCLERDVLRNQKVNLREEWLRVKPHHTSDDHKPSPPQEGSIAHLVNGVALPIRVKRKDWPESKYFTVEREHAEHKGVYYGTETKEDGTEEKTIWGNEADKIGWEIVF